MNKTEQSRIAFDQQADTYDSDFHGKHEIGRAHV